MQSARIRPQTSDAAGGGGGAEASSRAAGTSTRRSVGLDTRQPFWPRVLRVDGCMGAIAMAPPLRRRSARLGGVCRPI